MFAATLRQLANVRPPFCQTALKTLPGTCHEILRYLVNFSAPFPASPPSSSLVICPVNCT